MEQLVSLNIDNWAIFQDKGVYSFTQDSVILANLANVSSSDRVLDLGCGNGILSFLIYCKKNPKLVIGIEKQKILFDMCTKSCEYNKTDNRIKFINADVKDIRAVCEHESFDVVVCNPPYFSSSIDSQNEHRCIARTDTENVLPIFIQAAAFSLRFGGDLYCSYKCDRLCDLFCILRENNLEPKDVTLIYTKQKYEPEVCIVKARKGGKPGLNIHSLVIMNEDGSYTSNFQEVIK